MNTLVDVGDGASQGVTKQDHSPDPKKSADDVVGEVVPVIHFCGAGNGRAEGADDGDKSSEDDGLAAIGLVKFVGALRIVLQKNSNIAKIILAVQQ